MPTYEKVYRGMPLLATNYFKLLCANEGLRGTYDAIPEDPTGTKQSSATFTISLSGRETYQVMQKVFEAQNG